jgi:flavin-binding protein dodecin
MAVSVAKVTELSCMSTESFQDAIENGIANASKTLRNIKSAWVQDQKVVVEDGKVTAYKVLLKVTFVLDDRQ